MLPDIMQQNSNKKSEFTTPARPQTAFFTHFTNLDRLSSKLPLSTSNSCTGLYSDRVSKVSSKSSVNFSKSSLD